MIIYDNLPIDLVNPDGNSTGLIPRDYSTHPRGCYSNIQAIDIPIIPQSEYRERIRDRKAAKARLQDIRNKGNKGQQIPSLDQSGNGYQDGYPKWGYCWSHSATHLNMILRALAGLPYVPLSAFAIAATIKNGRNQGGWGAQAVDFITERGQPSQKYWPQDNVNLSNGTSECWENASHYKITEGFIDVAVAQYDRKFSWEQQCTFLLSGIPLIGDYNWWGHSVCDLDLFDGEVERPQARHESGKLLTLEEFDIVFGMNNPVTGGIGKEIWNSWSDAWGDKGIGRLTGSRAISDGSVAPRQTTPSI